MSGATWRRAEWERLCAERAALRASLAGSLHELRVRADDPFGLKERVRRHPILAAGLAAGAGAVLVKLLAPRRAADPGGSEDAKVGAEAGEGPSALDAVRDAALSAATAWITRFVTERLGHGAAPAVRPPAGERRS